MADDTGARAFAAFRERVVDDFNLRTWLQVPLEREAYVQRVVALGAERHLVFAPDDVRAAMRAGERTSLMQGIDEA